MRCSSCGSENPEGVKFCNECATPFPRRCASCGFANPPAAKFCGECAAPLGGAAVTAARPTPATSQATPNLRVVENAGAPPEGERKTVTALFADIKGSMDLMEDLDPEEARTVVDPALKLMIDACRRYDGYVVQSTGDGIFALFGAPLAHEDHPQRALFAALRMQDEMRRYSTKLREAGNPPLEARVGVNTGETVVRSIKTGDAHTEYTPIGHSTSLASRMQTLAPTGSIAVTEATQKFCAGYFSFKALGPTRVKGVTEPVNVFEVTGIGPLRTRLQRAAGRGFSKFVGRQREMDAMKHAAAQAKAGHGQIVAAIAEAGVGKSRLFFEFKATSQAGKAVSQSGWMVLETFSVSHGKATTFLPLIELLSNYFNISAEDDARRRREKVAGRLAILDPSLEDTRPYIFALLGIADNADPHRQWEQNLDRLEEYLQSLQKKDTLAQMDPQIQRRRTLDAIKRILIRESLNQPLMVICEDLHWIDNETQAFLNLLADSIGTARILLLVNYRPEYSHSWSNKTYYTQLRLDPLGKESADEMLASLLGDDVGLDALKRLIIERTEGNPFFMEETVQVLLDEGALVRNGATKLTRPLGELKIPPTVQAILTSRIDRLPPDEKDLLQTLAVLGKEFSLPLVRHVAGKPLDEIDQMLNDLQLAEFIYEQPAFGDIEYTFKHALTREVVYGGLLKERRKLLHKQIGVAIETLYAGQLDGHLGELARHYSLSPDAQKAVEYLHLAGEQAIKRSAHAEAVTDSEAALSLLQTLPASRERDRRELALQILLGSAGAAVKGPGAPERERSLLRARDLSQRLGEQSHVFPVLWQLFHFHAQRGELQTAREYAEHALAVAESQCDAVMLAGARTALGLCLFYIGDFAACRRQFELALAQDIPLQKRWYFGRGFDALAGALSALAEGILGYPDRCCVGVGEVVKRARTQSSLPDLAFALVACGRGHLLAGSPSSAQSLAEETITLSETYGYVERAALGKCVRGVALTRQGELKEGIACILQGLSDYSATGGRLGQSEFYSALAAAFGKAGRTQEGLEAVDLGLAMGRDGGESFYRGELYRIRGELIQIEDPAHPHEVERLFRTAIDIASRRQARSFELRATTSLARLLAKQNRRDEARAMLAEIYNWFTEGFDTADLKDAKALLEELSA